jgi:hypothetical protein
MNYKIYLSSAGNTLQEVPVEIDFSQLSNKFINMVNDIYNYLYQENEDR